MSTLIRYKKLFGSIRLLLGMLFVIYPFAQYLNSRNAQGEETSSWMFALLFFILYAISALANGIREIQGKQPAFSLLRFFEITLNSFIAVYLVIILFAVKLNHITVFLLAVLVLVVAISALRDMRYISIQYYDRKQKMKDKNIR